jgi:hypothetical protein
MKKYIFTLGVLLFAGCIGSFAQVPLIQNMVGSKHFETAKDIYSTFTQGVVHYEAEIMYIYGEVYVAKTMPDSSTHKLPTFRSAYLMPIYSQYKKNQGKVHPDYDGEMFLFLHIKYDPKKTYQKLWEQLSPYNEILTFRRGNEWQEGKLRIIFVGDAPMRVFQQERVGFASAQGTIADIAKNYDNRIMPLIGIDFTNDLNWNGMGKMPFDQFLKFKEVVKSAQDQKKKVRVYNCPEDENIWEVMLTAGVDMISTSDPDHFAKFLASRTN